jgi:hypothetical protein
MKRTSDHTPDWRKAVAGLHVSLPKELGPVTHNIMFHNNPFSLQESEITPLNL